MHRKLLYLAWPYIFLAVLASLIVNLLFLTSPIYLTQIYQRVLGSQSQNTLFALTAIMVLAFACLSLFERLRSWVFGRLATRIDLKIAPLLLQSHLAKAQRGSASNSDLRQVTTDLDQVRRFMTGPGPSALIDLPLLGLYVVVLFAIHPWLGAYALAGAVLVLLLAVIGFWRQSGQSQRHSSAKLTSYRAVEKADQGQDLIRAQGLAPLVARVLSLRRLALSREEARSTAEQQSWSSFGKGLRMVLQSGILGLAALLVLREVMPPALIFASMILLGRVMAPIDVLSNAWSSVLSAQTAWQRLGKIALQDEAPVPGLALESPQGQLSLLHVGLRVPQPQGRDLTILEDISADIPAGALVALIGPSGAGKTSLLRALAGLAQLSDGQVLYDGLDIQRLADSQRADLLSWTPQSPQFLPGTIADNLSGYRAQVSAEALIQAASLAQIHERITQLPVGYQTPVDLAERIFSGGEMARLSLARALFGLPKVLLLDEPTAALEVNLRQQLMGRLQGLAHQGHTLIIATHDPWLIHQASHIMRLDAGRLAAFGPSAEILGGLQTASRAPVVSPRPGLQLVSEGRRHTMPAPQMPAPTMPAPTMPTPTMPTPQPAPAPQAIGEPFPGEDAMQGQQAPLAPQGSVPGAAPPPFPGEALTPRKRRPER